MHAVIAVHFHWIFSFWWTILGFSFVAFSGRQTTKAAAVDEFFATRHIHSVIKYFEMDSWTFENFLCFLFDILFCRCFGISFRFKFCDWNRPNNNCNFGMTRDTADCCSFDARALAHRPIVCCSVIRRRSGLSFCGRIHSKSATVDWSRINNEMHIEVETFLSVSSKNIEEGRKLMFARCFASRYFDCFSRSTTRCHFKNAIFKQLENSSWRRRRDAQFRTEFRLCLAVFNYTNWKSFREWKKFKISKEELLMDFPVVRFELAPCARSAPQCHCDL